MNQTNTNQKIQRTIQFFDSNLESVNGFFVGKRSRLFHSAGVNNEVLPMDDYEKTALVELKE